MRISSYVIITLLLIFNQLSIAAEVTMDHMYNIEKQPTGNLLAQSIIQESTTTNDSRANTLQYQTEKLSPIMRAEPVSAVKYNIKDVLPFLKNILILDKPEQMNNLPFVYAFVEGNIIGGKGSQLLVKGLNHGNNSIYTFLRSKATYQHPDTGEFLGTEFITIGTAEVLKKGQELTKMQIIKSSYPIEKQDKLIPKIELDVPEYLQGVIPAHRMRGYILNVEDGLWDIGKYNSVLISLGARDGLAQGHILNILRMNYRKDLLPARKYNKKRRQKENTNAEFASIKYGELIVYKVFDKISIGLVLDAKHPITLLDVVTSEEQS